MCKIYIERNDKNNYRTFKKLNKGLYYGHIRENIKILILIQLIYKVYIIAM